MRRGSATIRVAHPLNGVMDSISLPLCVIVSHAHQFFLVFILLRGGHPFNLFTKSPHTMVGGQCGSVTSINCERTTTNAPVEDRDFPSSLTEVEKQPSQLKRTGCPALGRYGYRSIQMTDTARDCVDELRTMIGFQRESPHMHISYTSHEHRQQSAPRHPRYTYSCDAHRARDSEGSKTRR